MDRRKEGGRQIEGDGINLSKNVFQKSRIFDESHPDITYAISIRFDFAVTDY